MGVKTLNFKVNLKSTTPELIYSRHKVYTNDDNAVKLEFAVQDFTAEELTTATASLLLYMRDGSFFKIEDANITKSGSTFSYTLQGTQGKHDGVAQAQLLVTIGAAELATQKYEFEIISGLDQAVAVEVMIQDWTTLTAEARAFIDQAELDEAQRISNENARIAAENQRINDFSNKADKTYVDQQDSEILAQLNEKVSKIEFSDNLSYVSMTTQDMEVNSNSSFVMTITLTDTFFTKNTLYKYNKDGEYKESFCIGENVKVYTLNNYQSLYWDLTDNLLKIANDSFKRPDNAILLAVNSKGVLFEGVFARYFVAKKVDTMKYTAFSNTIDLDNIDSLYSYTQDSNIYFKWTGNINIGTKYKIITRSFDQLLIDLGAYYKIDSPEWVKDCVYLEKGFFVAYDDTQGKFVVNSFANQTINNYVIIAENRAGYIGGEIADLVANQAIDYSRLRSNHIKPYYISTIESKENEVLPLLNENVFTFGYSTDHHVQEWENGHTNQTYNVMEKVVKSLNLDCVLNSGDHISYGSNDKSRGLGGLKDIANKLSFKDKLYLGVGNHDYNGSSPGSAYNPDGKQRKTWIITPYETYHLLGKHHEGDVVWGSKEMMYYYKDFTDKKIRVIFINSSDNNWNWLNDGSDYLEVDPTVVSGIRQQQAEWLVNTALNFSDKSDKAEWHTLVVSHVPIFRSGDGMTWNTPFQENDNSVRTILKSFMEGTNNTISFTDSAYGGVFSLNLTANFASQGAMKLIGVFSGHNHLDRHVKSAYGLNNITTTCAYADQSLTTVDSEMSRIVPQYSELALDVVVVDKLQRKVTLKRFGAGADREFTY